MPKNSERVYITCRSCSTIAIGQKFKKENYSYRLACIEPNGKAVEFHFAGYREETLSGSWVATVMLSCFVGYKRIRNTSFVCCQQITPNRSIGCSTHELKKYKFDGVNNRFYSCEHESREFHEYSDRKAVRIITNQRMMKASHHCFFIRMEACFSMSVRNCRRCGIPAAH